MTAPHGVLVVDKPKGPTSHDVVQWARRALGTRAIGHAGTLDPMATGVLVLAVGEGTKLVPYLTADDKRYLATIALGVETDTLDAEGSPVETLAPSEPITLERACAAARAFVGPHRQRPPAYSAIKVDGTPLHARARRGEEVHVEERDVVVHQLEILRADSSSIDLDVTAAKGFYVRSLARDLARALGTRGHLTALRRTRSGPFGIDDAIEGELLRRARTEPDAAERARSALIPLSEACSGMPRVALDEAGTQDALHGRAIDPSHVRRGGEHAGHDPVALLGSTDRLVAIASWSGPSLRILRGIREADAEA